MKMRTILALGLAVWFVGCGNTPDDVFLEEAPSDSEYKAYYEVKQPRCFFPSGIVPLEHGRAVKNEADLVFYIGKRAVCIPIETTEFEVADYTPMDWAYPEIQFGAKKARIEIRFDP